MNDIKRQKITERVNFEYDDLLHIARKSNERCCHCGRKVYFGYGATVEHFVPISKGGLNRDINLVMLCKDCNESKGNFIYDPDDYLEFLNEEHKEKLKGYFNSYIESFDFVNRDNLLAYDKYKVNVALPIKKLHYSAMAQKKNIQTPTIPLWVQKATIDDLDKVTEYYIKYLKKYNQLDSEEAARINIAFWITFGCIYYVEKDNEIKTMITVSITKANEEVNTKRDWTDNYLTINLFSYYDTDLSLTLARNLSHSVPCDIMAEQKLDQIPVRLSIFKEDVLSSAILNDPEKNYEIGPFLTGFFLMRQAKAVKNHYSLREAPKLKTFFNKFSEINEAKLDKWFKDYGQNKADFEWMLCELTLPGETENDENMEEIVNE